MTNCEHIKVTSLWSADQSEPSWIQLSVCKTDANKMLKSSLLCIWISSNSGAVMLMMGWDMNTTVSHIYSKLELIYLLLTGSDLSRTFQCLLVSFSLFRYFTCSSEPSTFKGKYQVCSLENKSKKMKKLTEWSFVSMWDKAKKKAG